MSWDIRRDCPQECGHGLISWLVSEQTLLTQKDLRDTNPAVSPWAPRDAPPQLEPVALGICGARAWEAELWRVPLTSGPRGLRRAPTTPPHAVPLSLGRCSPRFLKRRAKNSFLSSPRSCQLIPPLSKDQGGPATQRAGPRGRGNCRHHAAQLTVQRAAQESQPGVVPCRARARQAAMLCGAFPLKDPRLAETAPWGGQRLPRTLQWGLRRGRCCLPAAHRGCEWQLVLFPASFAARDGHVMPSGQ